MARGEPTPNLSKFRFGFGEQLVYFLKAPFPQQQLHIGRSLGPSPDGNYLCQRILTSDNQVISRSACESVANIKAKSLKIKSLPSTESRGDKRGNSVDTQEQTLEEMMDDYEAASTTEQESGEAGLNMVIDTAIDPVNNQENTNMTDGQEDEVRTDEEEEKKK